MNISDIPCIDFFAKKQAPIAKEPQFWLHCINACRQAGYTVDEIQCKIEDISFIYGNQHPIWVLRKMRRWCKCATASNKAFSQWNEVFADVTIASAILDRVLHHCTVVNIKGESYRLKERKEFMRQKQQIVNTLFEQGNA